MKTLERLEAERQFHNERFGQEHDKREGLNKWYRAIAAGAEEQNRLIREWGRDKTVLEYGCADGALSILEQSFAGIAKAFHGIDISDQAIEKARARAAERGLGNCHFEVMNAEAMTLADDSFDLVFGRGIIHHLDLQRAFPEIARILRPGGRALFFEPMGHNPLINRFRDRTPDLRTPDEHPLLNADFVLARRYFRTVEHRPYGLLTLGAVPFHRTVLGDPLLALCGVLDKIVFTVPMLRKQAWYSLMVLTK